MLLVAVLRVSKPDGAIGVDDDVVDAIEPSAVVVGDDRFHLVRPLCGHISQATAGGQGALFTEEDAVFVVDCAVGKVDAWVEEFILVATGWAFFENAGDLNEFLTVLLQLIASHENVFRRWYVDGSLVKIGLISVVQDAADFR